MCGLAGIGLTPLSLECDGTELADTLTWDFNSGSEAFDFLASGESLILTYIVSTTDDAGTPLSDIETITVTITGSNDPVILPAIDIVGSLVEERINRHEIEVVLDRQITPRIAAAVVGGFGWEFEDEEFVYRAGLNLSYKLRDNVFIQAALDYDSSGNSTNSGSEVIFASILLRIFF